MVLSLSDSFLSKSATRYRSRMVWRVSSVGSNLEGSRRCSKAAGGDLYICREPFRDMKAASTRIGKDLQLGFDFTDANPELFRAIRWVNKHCGCSTNTGSFTHASAPPCPPISNPSSPKPCSALPIMSPILRTTTYKRVAVCGGPGSAVDAFVSSTAWLANDPLMTTTF